MTDDVVFSYPYEGALYYLLSRSNPHPAPPLVGHPYYENLYGPTAERNQSKAVNLGSLFNNIILTFADEYLPDHHLYRSGSRYFHPHLRVEVSENYQQQNELRAIAQEILAAPDFQSVLRSSHIPLVNRFSENDLVMRIIVQLITALRRKATIVAGDEVAAVINAIFSSLRDFDVILPGSEQPKTISIDPSELPLVGLNWDCRSLDGFAAVRQSSEVTGYAAGFRQALFEAASSTHGETTDKLVLLMKEARGRAEIAKLAKGTFETVGTIATMVGAVPVAGTVATLAGLSTTLAANKAARSAQRDHWYLIGPRMNEVAFEASLSS